MMCGVAPPIDRYDSFPRIVRQSDQDAMCKSGSDTLVVASRRSTAASSTRRRSRTAPAATSNTNDTTTTSFSSSSRHTAATTSSTRSTSSLAAARASLPDPPLLYSFHELAAATNSFLSKRASGSTYWRCSLRARDAALFQLRSAPGLDAATASAALATIARYHHACLARLLGACLAGAHVYLAYELPPGAATLAACLHGPRANPGFTVLRTWLSRVQVAADVAQGLDYVHNHAAAVHGRVSPSTVLVTDPGLRARLTHFGADHLAHDEDEVESSGSASCSPYRSGSGSGSREADVYAFGVLLLELLSGEAAARYRFDRGSKVLVRVSVVEAAEEAAKSGRVRSWVDRRLGDSFPVAAAERLVEVGLRCAGAAAGELEEKKKMPEMAWVAGKVSKVYVESRAWEQKLQAATELSLSAVTPR